jgi:hypothetical protein
MKINLNKIYISGNGMWAHTTENKSEIVLYFWLGLDIILRYLLHIFLSLIRRQSYFERGGELRIHNNQSVLIAPMKCSNSRVANIIKLAQFNRFLVAFHQYCERKTLQSITYMFTYKTHAQMWNWASTARSMRRLPEGLVCVSASHVADVVFYVSSGESKR